VIIVDTNLLVYAHITDYAQHAVVKKWWLRQLAEVSRVGLPWASLLGFARIVTHPKIYKAPMSNGQAFEWLSSWLSLKNVWTPEPTEKHLSVLSSLLRNEPRNPKLIPDAHLAALAVEHSLTLCSADKDFAKFKEVNWFNPVAS
jgi:toxin-antitoxin system PIN domain toxin